LHENASDYIEAEYLPENAEILEPSKMKKVKLNDFFEHWHIRQEEGKVPLRFKAARDGDKERAERKLKKRKRYMDLSDEEEEEESGSHKVPRHNEQGSAG
jgi:hypothetical protein